MTPTPTYSDDSRHRNNYNNCPNTYYAVGLLEILSHKNWYKIKQSLENFFSYTNGHN